MLNYYFSQHAYRTALENPNESNFLYHINTFDWPKEHKHQDFWEFTIVTNGTLINHIKNKTRSYSENSVLISRTGIPHYLLAKDKNNIRYINIIVRESYLINMLNSISPRLVEHLSSDSFNLILSNKTIVEIEKRLSYVNYTIPELYKDNDLLVSSVFMLLLSEISFSQISTKEELPLWMITLNKLIQTNEILSCSVNDLSQHLGYSCPRLTFLFKNQFGVTPHEYLSKYKFDYARELLLHTNETVSVISETLGFSTTMQFYATFKKRFGITPNEYRKSFAKQQDK